MNKPGGYSLKSPCSHFHQLIHQISTLVKTNSCKQTDRFLVDDGDMDSDTVAESDMSSKSGSFLHKVSDRVRKRQDQSSKDETQDSDKHSVLWGMCMSSTLQASVFMGKNLSENLHSIKNAGKDFTMK